MYSAPQSQSERYVEPAFGFRFAVLDVAKDWAWVSKRLKCHLVEDSGGIIAFNSHDEPVAACVADSFTATACCVHIVVDNPLVIRRGFLQAVARALFIVMRRHVLIGLTPGDNEKALSFNRRIGWREIYRVRDGHALGVDLVVQEMRREDCRWLTKEERYDG